MHLNWLRKIIRIMARITGIAIQWVSNKSYGFRSDLKGCFPALSNSEWWKCRIKVCFSRVLQCFGPFSTLSAEGCSETRNATHSSIHVFLSQWFLKYLYYWTQVFFNIFLILCKFWKCNKISAKRFWFLR